MAITGPIPLPGSGIAALSSSLDTMFSDLLHKRNSALHPSGDVANALYIEQLRNKYGANDPRYLEAKRAHDMVLSARQSLIGYRDTLNQTAGIRATSPLGKLLAEGNGRGAQDILNQNYGRGQNQNQQVGTHAPVNSRYKVGEQYYNEEGEPIYSDNETAPIGNNQVNSPRTSEEKRAYEQAIAKGTTDAAIRNKIPYAENVKITMDNINPDALVQFSGPKGHLRLIAETLKSATGTASPEFLEYQTALTGANTLKKQLRQFWGDSIQPAAAEQIGKLTNPSHWSKSPEVAKQQFLQLKHITDQELESFTRHGTSPVKLDYDKKSGEFYTAESPKKSNKSPLQQKVEGTKKNAPNTSEEDVLIEGYLPELSKINPEYTADNIKHTARELGISVGEVIDQLFAKGSNHAG